jgi:hypothetical protein
MLVLLFMLFGFVGAQTDDSVDKIERLALRLLGGADDDHSQTQLLLSAVPEDLLFTFTLIPEAELLGSYLRRSSEGALMTAQIVIESPLDLDASLAFYDELLRQQSWLVKLAPQALGFVNEVNLLTAMYCHPEGLSFTYVTASRLATGSDVRFDIYRDETYSPCRPEQELVGAGLDLNDAPLPLLYPPDDASVVTLNKLLIVEPLSLSVLLTTQRSQAELLDHYKAQLISAGWQQISQGESGDLSFGRWTYRDSSGLIWTSILTVMGLGVEDEYYASVIVLLPVEGEQP